MSTERIDELLAKAAAIDRALQMPVQPSDARNVMAILSERDALRMEAAGYRAEALVLQLRGPRRCPVSHEGKRQCELDEGHDGVHRSRFPSGNWISWP